MSDHLRLTVTEVTNPTADSIAIYFDAAGKIDTFLPGQFLTFSVEINGKNVRRSYSICTAPSELPRIGVAVKRVKDGLMSNFLADYVRKDAVLDIMKPYGTFTLNTSLSSLPTLALFAAGSGITPMMSILKTALQMDSSSKVYLFYGNQNQNTIIFKDELDQLQAQYNGRLQVTHILDNPNPGWEGVNARITAEMTTDLLKYYNLNNDSVFYMCGPAGMMDSVQAGLSNGGISPDRVHRETFFLQTDSLKEEAAAAAASADGPKNVKIIYEGQTHEILVAPGVFILDAAIDAGLDLPYACQMGICGMCRATKVQGSMHISDSQESLSASEIASGACLTCCATPESNDLVIDYDHR